MSLLAAPVALLVLPPLLMKVHRILGGFEFLFLVANLLLLFTTLSKRIALQGGNGSWRLGIMIHQHQRLQPGLRIVVTPFCVVIRQIILDLVVLGVACFYESI
jgi:hypothetical protein